jgi:hypothetical protein
MKRPGRLRTGLCLALLAGLVMAPAARAETYDLVARYVLETVRAFRTAYVLHVIEHIREVGVSPKEDWIKNAHAVPLPAQFVKTAGSDLDTFEIGIVGLTPIYKSNLPRTPAETDALRKLSTDRSQKIITFMDGNQFKAMAADIAVVQSCADCHNNHPDSAWRNFKKGDIMGAIVVRINRHD